MIDQDLKGYYKNKRIEDFREKKQTDIEIHEIITRISINITKYWAITESFFDTIFFSDIMF